MGQLLYRRRFEGQVAAWLGSHAPHRTRQGLKIAYTIQDQTEGLSVGAD